MQKEKIITRLVLLVSFVSLFTDVASEMLYPIMPVFLKSIGFSVLLIGVLEGLAEATAGLTKGYFGQRSDVIGRRVPFIRWGYAMSAISKPMMAAFSFPLWIFFARTLDRLGKGVRTSARDALLSDEAKAENKGKVFGFHRALDTVGAAIGPLIALLFLWKYPGQYQWLFILAFLPGALATSLTFLLTDRKSNRDHSTPRPGIFDYLGYWKKASPAYRKLVTGLLIFTLFNSSDAFLLLATKDALGSDTQMIGYYVFYNLLYALASFPLGSLADRVGMKTLLFSGLGLFALVYFLFGFASAWIHFALLFAAYAIYAASTEGISKAFITNLSGREDTATAIGFYTSFASLAALLASSIGGLLWYLFSAKVMFMVAASGVSLALIYLLANRHIMKPTPQTF